MGHIKFFFLDLFFLTATSESVEGRLLRDGNVTCIGVALSISFCFFFFFSNSLKLHPIATRYAMASFRMFCSRSDDCKAFTEHSKLARCQIFIFFRRKTGRPDFHTLVQGD